MDNDQTPSATIHRCLSGVDLRCCSSDLVTRRLVTVDVRASDRVSTIALRIVCVCRSRECLSHKGRSRKSGFGQGR